ncbi:MAG: orotate phosphoribosyltransferase [Cuniculiplasma sp.]
MLKDLLMEEKAVKQGNFVLTSGKTSNYYVDIKDACARPQILKEIVFEITKKLNARNVAGVELGAVPILVGVAYEMKIPYLIIRKEAKHGMKKLLIGNVEPGMEVNIIEDVVTTGNSVLKAVKLLRENGCVVTRAITVVDREEGGYELLKENGVELVPLVRLKEIFKN